MQVAAADYQHAAAERGRHESLDLGDVGFVEGIRLVGKYDDVGAAFDGFLERGRGIALAGGGVDVVVTEHPEHVVRVGVAVEGHPRLLPYRAEDAQSQLAPYAERGLDAADAERDLLGQPGGGSLATQHAAQAQDRFNRAGNSARIGREDGDAGGAQLLDVFATVLLGIGDDQLGLKLYDGVDVRVLGAAD